MNKTESPHACLSWAAAASLPVTCLQAIASRTVANPVHCLTGAVFLLLAACGQPDHPQLAMCESVGKNLLGAVSWADNSVSENPNRMTVKIAYSEESGRSGSIQCIYPRERTDDGNGPLATAPSDVLINGERVATADLFRAGTRASATELGKVADETQRQGAELARETGQKANELANQAGAKAGELADQASQKAGELAVEASRRAGELGEQAEELAGQAGEIAGQAGDRARELLLDATRKVQQKLENQ